MMSSSENCALSLASSDSRSCEPWSEQSRGGDDRFRDTRAGGQNEILGGRDVTVSASTGEA
jgi:hypothetical protein